MLEAFRKNIEAAACSSYFLAPKCIMHSFISPLSQRPQLTVSSADLTALLCGLGSSVRSCETLATAGSPLLLLALLTLHIRLVLTPDRWATCL